VTTELIITLVVAVVYLGIGIWVCFFGPMEELLRRFRFDMSFGMSMMAWATSSEKTSPPMPTRWRIWGLWLSVHIGSLLLWPIFLPGALKAKRAQRQGLEAYYATRPRQRLQSIGQCGGFDLICNACLHSEELPGKGWLYNPETKSHAGWDMPWQCLTCRRFTATGTAGGMCECGGVLSREHLTLCPNCGLDDVKLTDP
jgi:hypothetical protein